MKRQFALTLGLVALDPCAARVDCGQLKTNGKYTARGEEYGSKLSGLDLKISEMGASYDMTSDLALQKAFSQCQWGPSNIKESHWLLPKCIGLTGEYSHCDYANLCELLCIAGGNCGQIWFNDFKVKSCNPYHLTRHCRATSTQQFALSLNTKKAHIFVGSTTPGRALTLKDMAIGADIDIRNPDALRLHWPECPWTSATVRDDYWELKDCKCGNLPCNQCSLAELCGSLCAAGNKCKHWLLSGNWCFPKSAAAWVAKPSHISGKPIKLCFAWSLAGILELKKEDENTGRSKMKEYGNPKAEQIIDEDVLWSWAKNYYLTLLYDNGHVKRVTCPEAIMVSGHAMSRPPLWIALAAMTWSWMCGL